jgi:hypothetical protein
VQADLETEEPIESYASSERVLTPLLPTHRDLPITTGTQQLGQIRIVCSIGITTPPEPQIVNSEIFWRVLNQTTLVSTVAISWREIGVPKRQTPRKLAFLLLNFEHLSP